MEGQMAPVDQAKAVRRGEELDASKLADYLRRELPGVVGDGNIEVRQFLGGHSNLTYLIRAEDTELVLRRPPFGSKVKSAHDMSREYRVLSALQGAYPLSPVPLLYCEDEAVAGATFYVMKRIEGLIIRKDLPPGLELEKAALTTLQTRFVDTLVRLHQTDHVAAGLGEFGKPEGYVRRQVEGWSRRYLGAKTDDIVEIDLVARFLSDHLPAESGACLIHNDYKLDNVVLSASDPAHIKGVLDWEMSTVGDPLMDLGTTLSYWVTASDPQEIQAFRMGPTHLPGALSRVEMAGRYEAQSGRAVRHPVYYYVFGLFKTAVVLQQIYYRYHQGLTADPRFEKLIDTVKVLAVTAHRATQTGKL